MQPRSLLAPLLSATALAFVASSCGSSQGHGGGAGSGSGASSQGGTGGTGGAATGACEPGDTRACACAEGVGVSRCTADGVAYAACECAAYGRELAVSPQGDDGAAGTLAAPFRTLPRARQAVRELVNSGLPAGGVVVWLREGAYSLGETFSLGAEDSGSADRPVAYRGYPGERVRLIGGVAAAPAAFQPVPASSLIHDRLDPAVRAAVRQVSLPSLGVTDYGALVRRGFCGEAGTGPLEVYVDGAPMTLARWPDAADNDLPADLEHAAALELFGAPSPDVSGHYVKDGEQDGVSSFTREGAVAGKPYHLYRSTWDYQGSTYTAWFLTTGASGYPTDDDPWWYRYDPKLGPLDPGTGASGKPSTADPGAINHGFAAIAEAPSGTVFRYAGARPERWSKAGTVWLHGFWKYAWADCHLPAASIDTASKTITLSEAPDYGLAAGQPFYAYDLPEEITTPGEYWIDRGDGTLYLLPPAGFDQAEVVLSTLDAPLVALSGASHVTLADLTLEAGRSELVRIDGGESDALVGLTLRNAGAGAGSIDGRNHRVSGCHVLGTGNGGFRVSGGDRPSLAPGGNVVESSHFHDLSRWEWTYRPAARLEGVGQVARHNLIHDLPHSAFLYGGNEHTIERNVIHHVLRFSSDAGAIYAGRDWGGRGNVIRHNFIHDLATFFDGFGVHGIYLDDCLSGVRVEGNVLYRISGYGIEHGGGRDDVMVGNVVARCGAALSADSRGFEWQPAGGPNDVPGDSWNLLEKLEQVHYQQDPWASRYPACAAIPDDFSALVAPGAKWLYPEGCSFSRNVGFANGSFITATDGTLAVYAEVAGNLPDTDPLFVDEQRLDLSLRPDSPALAIPGFAPIPFADIGIPH